MFILSKIYSYIVMYYSIIDIPIFFPSFPHRNFPTSRIKYLLSLDYDKNGEAEGKQRHQSQINLFSTLFSIFWQKYTFLTDSQVSFLSATTPMFSHYIWLKYWDYGWHKEILYLHSHYSNLKSIEYFLLNLHWSVK